MNIVLVHGVLGFREKFGVEYFRGVAEHFRKRGLRVFVPELDPTRGIELRGTQLRDQVTAAFSSGALESGAKTHIVAHSMGGLDSRYVLSPANPHGLAIPIRSLTTISTPHRGSPVADALDKTIDFNPFPHLPFSPPGNPLESALHALGISLDSMRNLTTGFCRGFSARYVDRADVTYFSVAGVGRPVFPQTAGPLLLFHQFIWAKTGQPNDGMVPKASADWGTIDPQPWFADHSEEIGYNLDHLAAPPVFPYLEKYDELVARVANL